MAKERKPGSKERLARAIQNRIAQSATPDDLQKSNTEFASNVSNSIAQSLESLTIDSQLQLNDKQMKIFENMLKSLENISKSDKNTSTERKDVRKLLVKLTAQAEIEIVNLHREVKQRETQIKELEEKKNLTEEETEKVNTEKEKLQKEVDVLTKKMEYQERISKEARIIDPGAPKDLSGKDMIKKGLVSDLSNILPGLSFEQKEGENFRGMLSRNAKSLLTPKGAFQGLFGKVAPANNNFENMVEGEKKALEIENMRKNIGKTSNATTTKTSTTSEDLDLEFLKKKQGFSDEQIEEIKRLRNEQNKSTTGEISVSENKSTTGEISVSENKSTIVDAIEKETSVTQNILELVQKIQGVQEKQNETLEKEKNTVTSDEQQDLFNNLYPASPQSVASVPTKALLASTKTSSATNTLSESENSEDDSKKGSGGIMSSILGGIGSSVLGRSGKKLFGRMGGKMLAKLGGKGLSKGLLKGAGKGLLKKIPGIGLVAGLGFGASRLMSGDWKGALGEVASGAAGTIPGIGTAASMAIDAGLASRDAGALGGVTSTENNTAMGLEGMTEQANIPPAPIAPTNNIINNINKGPSSSGPVPSPNMPAASIRTIENSFIRFQDKRVARI